MKRIHPTFVMAAALSAAFVLPPQSLAAKTFPISSCPFQADVAGATYTVTQALVGTGQGDCIAVTAPGITIKLNGYGILTNGGDRSGISISKGANGAKILGGGASIGGALWFCLRHL